MDRSVAAQTSSRPLLVPVLGPAVRLLGATSVQDPGEALGLQEVLGLLPPPPPAAVGDDGGVLRDVGQGHGSGAAVVDQMPRQGAVAVRGEGGDGQALLVAGLGFLVRVANVDDEEPGPGLGDEGAELFGRRDSGLSRHGGGGVERGPEGGLAEGGEGRGGEGRGRGRGGEGYEGDGPELELPGTEEGNCGVGGRKREAVWGGECRELGRERRGSDRIG